MSSADELANFKMQLEQVEAALLKEPNSEELLTLKTNLQEVISLQEEVLRSELAEQAASSDGAPMSHFWKMGDRVLARGTNGQHYPAVIDGISGTSASVTFLGNKQQIIVELSSLRVAPTKEKSVFEAKRPAPGQTKEWQAERERKYQKRLKKEAKRKEMEQAKVAEQTSWQKFNAKAAAKHMKGIKKLAVCGSAPDTVNRAKPKKNEISSRRDDYRQSNRGNMESLF